MIKLGSPDITAADIQRAVAVLESGNLIQGEQVLQFEKKIADFLNLSHCAVVSSCTAALHLALKALNIGPGDAVIVPAFTFPASANVVENLGAEVILCDVSPDTYVVTPERVEALIEQHQNKTIKAIMVVHAFGYPVDMQKMASLAQHYRLPLIEDAACALGTIADGYPVGHYSDFACFSFHPRKALTTGEGGAVVAKDAALIQQIKLLRNHGIQAQDGRNDFVIDGLNYRMTEFQAALALGQMDRFHQTLEHRRSLAAAYHQHLGDKPGLSIPAWVDGHSWQSYMIVLDADSHRDTLIERLLSENIQTNLGAQALNCLSYYQKKYALDALSQPEATRLYQQGLVLPLHAKLTLTEVQQVCDTVIRLLQ